MQRIILQILPTQSASQGVCFLRDETLLTNPQPPNEKLNSGELKGGRVLYWNETIDWWHIFNLKYSHGIILKLTKRT